MMLKKAASDVAIDFTCEVSDRSFTRQRGSSVHQTRQVHKPHEEVDAKSPAKPERKEMYDASPAKGFEGRPGEFCDENNVLAQADNGVQTKPGEVPAEGTSKNLAHLEAHSACQATGVSDAAVAHKPTGHTFWGVSLERESGHLRLASSSCAERGGCVRACRRQQGGVTGAARGARPKDRRLIPPGLLSDSGTDDVEAPCFTEYQVPAQEMATTSDEWNSSSAVANVEGTQPNETSSPSISASHYVCPECNRAFGTKIMPTRMAFATEGMPTWRDIMLTLSSKGSKPRWHKEEEYLMVVYEVQLRRQKVYNLNHKLHNKFPNAYIPCYKIPPQRC
ncbi:hypothetical protein MTO96_033729 [Rhipicephalus appendiculatus]